MDPRFQSSFIPKKPLETGGLRPQGDVNLFLVLSIAVTIIMCAAAGGVYLYQITLTKNNTAKDEQIKAARASFGIEDIAELKIRSRQLSAAQQLVNSHSAPSLFFSLLERNTLKNVRFKTFSMSTSEGGILLKMTGEGRSFNSVAYQSEVFTELTKEFTQPMLSNFVLEDTGRVLFDFSAALVPTVVSYAGQFANVSSTEGSGTGADTNTSTDETNVFP